MRSSEDLKQRWLVEAQQVFIRPGMYARSGPEMESVAGGRLRDLCYLDDRDDEYGQVREFLRGFGKVGVHGPFAAIFDVGPRCTDEVASVYAEVYHRLGYLPVERLLTADEWLPMTGLREWVDVRDMRRSEVEAAFGAPSLLVGKRVLCYAPADGAGGCFSIAAMSSLSGMRLARVVSTVDSTPIHWFVISVCRRLISRKVSS